MDFVVEKSEVGHLYGANCSSENCANLLLLDAIIKEIEIKGYPLMRYLDLESYD